MFTGPTLSSLRPQRDLLHPRCWFGSGALEPTAAPQGAPSGPRPWCHCCRRAGPGPRHTWLLRQHRVSEEAEEGARKPHRVLLGPPGGSLWSKRLEEGPALFLGGSCTHAWSGQNYWGEQHGHHRQHGRAAGLPEMWLLWTKKVMDGRDSVTKTTESHRSWKVALVKSPRLDPRPRGVAPTLSPVDSNVLPGGRGPGKL